MALTFGGYDGTEKLDSVFLLMEEVYHMQRQCLTPDEEEVVLGTEPFDGGEDKIVTFSDKFVNGRKSYKCSLCAYRFGKCRHRATVQAIDGVTGPSTFRFCPACSFSMLKVWEDPEIMVRRFAIADILYRSEQG